jgi:hypothetical protein
VTQLGRWYVFGLKGNVLLTTIGSQKITGY